MTDDQPPIDAGIAGGDRTAERGSALILAIFVLILLTAMGIELLFMTQTEMKMGQTDIRSKKIFYTAEAGLEDGRETLRVVNKSGATAALRASLDDELLSAAGPDGTIDFDADNVTAVYDSSGNVTGFTGYDDDVPLRAMATLGDSRYVAFLNNDSLDGKTSPDDTNDRLLITAVGAGPQRASEVVQAVVEHLAMPPFAATITIVGPAPTFDGGTTGAKPYTGNDCAVVGLHVPVIGVIGGPAESQAETGVHTPASYTSGSATGLATVDDIDGTIDASWKDCGYVHELARDVRAMADLVGDNSTPNSALTSVGTPAIIYIEGDYSIGGGFSGNGLLWVTGDLSISGDASWTGTILAVGKGSFQRNGGGAGMLSGATYVANVAGPDGLMWTSDDCAGPDGVVGNSDDGMASGTYDNPGGGTGATEYCTTAITAVAEQFPFVVTEFRQR